MVDMPPSSPWKRAQGTTYCVTYFGGVLSQVLPIFAPAVVSWDGERHLCADRHIDFHDGAADGRLPRKLAQEQSLRAIGLSNEKDGAGRRWSFRPSQLGKAFLTRRDRGWTWEGLGRCCGLVPLLSRLVSSRLCVCILFSSGCGVCWPGWPGLRCAVLRCLQSQLRHDDPFWSW